MALEFDVQNIIDIGLLLLLAFGAFQFFSSRQGAATEGNRAVWKQELQTLEESLRELIGEAGAASRNLDRNLLQRKRELENLLIELDSSEQRIAHSSAPDSSSDLPNATWAESSPTPEREAPQPQKQTKAAHSTAPSTSAGYGAGGILKKVKVEKKQTPQEALESIVGSAGGTMALSQQVTREVLRQQAQKRGADDKEHAASQALADKMAEANERVELDESERLTFESTSIMDPVTYKIARRLLTSGKEIHVVARKLELPVSEIRLLDRLIRRETAGEEEQEVQSDVELQAEETVNTLRRKPQETLADSIEASSFVADTPYGEGTFSAPRSRFGSDALVRNASEASAFISDDPEIDAPTVAMPMPTISDLDQDIERELALL